MAEITTRRDFLKKGLTVLGLGVAAVAATTVAPAETSNAQAQASSSPESILANPLAEALSIDPSNLEIVQSLNLSINVEGENPVGIAQILPPTDMSQGGQFYVAVEGSGTSYGWQITNGKKLGDPDMRRCGLSIFGDQLYFFLQDGSRIDLSPEGIKNRKQFTIIESIGKLPSNNSGQSSFVGGMSVSPDGSGVKVSLIGGQSRLFPLPSSLLEKSPDKMLSVDVVALPGSKATAKEIIVARSKA